MADIKHTGGCHCGAVRFNIWAPPKVTVYTCNCSICTKKQLKVFFVEDEKFEIVKGKEHLTQYTFNTHQAKYYFCKICGVQSFDKPRSHPHGMCIVYYCLDPGTMEVEDEVFFDGQNYEESIKKYIPDSQ